MTLQMRLYTRFSNIKESLHEIYRCVTESSGQFPLNIVNEIKGTKRTRTVQVNHVLSLSIVLFKTSKKDNA